MAGTTKREPKISWTIRWQLAWCAMRNALSSPQISEEDVVLSHRDGSTSQAWIFLLELQGLPVPTPTFFEWSEQNWHSEQLVTLGDGIRTGAKHLQLVHTYACCWTLLFSVGTPVLGMGLAFLVHCMCLCPLTLLGHRWQILLVHGFWNVCVTGRKQGRFVPNCVTDECCVSDMFFMFILLPQLSALNSSFMTKMFHSEDEVSR